MHDNYDVQVNERHMNKSRSHSNESDSENKTTKKNLQKIESYCLYQQNTPFFSVVQL